MPETVKSLVEEMRKLWIEFDENQMVYDEKGTAASAKRARMALGGLKKMVTSYRKTMVEEIKAKKIKAKKSKPKKK